jgi:hypothetical protein
MREDAAPEESAEVAFDEVGQPDPVGTRGGRGEEAFSVLLEDFGRRSPLTPVVGRSRRPTRIRTRLRKTPRIARVFA